MVGLKYGFCDRPEVDTLKVHKHPTSYLGGAAMILSFGFSFLPAAILLKFNLLKTGGIIFLAFFTWFLGFLDDWKFVGRTRKNTILKFILQIVGAIVFILGLRVLGLQFLFFGNVYLNFIFLFIFFILLHNAVNFQDGLDGLLGGIVAISLLAFLFLALFQGNIFNVFISLSLLGAVAGFLIFNFPPAKIFMGNNGSYLLGAILIFLVLNSATSGKVFGIVGPLLIIGMPILNGAFVFLRRLVKKQFVMAGDRHHLYDEIFYKFPPLRKAILINYLIHGILVIIGIFIVI